MEISSRISTSAMLAHQRQLDVISNNIANEGTTAFKRSRANLADIGYQAGITAPVGVDGAPVRLEGVGEGVELADIKADFIPGVAQPTGSGLDVALNGEGFLVVNMPSGTPGYTRDGSLHVDGAGQLVTAGGLPIRSADGGTLQLPENATAARIDESGQLVATVDGADTVVGQLALARFTNNNGLLANGQNIWLETPASGAAIATQPGDGGLSLIPGALEGSNVDVADEFTRMMAAQRGYQMNLKVVQAWDEIGRMANELRR